MKASELTRSTSFPLHVAQLAARATAPAWEEIARAREFIGEPFAEGRIEVLDTLSRSILTHVQLRGDASAVALGFWLRRANIARMIEAWQHRRSSGVEWVPAGTVFHVAPSNVDSMFVYSWALSFLAGNSNIVRVSGKTSGTLDTLIQLIAEAMKTAPDVWRGNWFVTYPHDDAANAWFSAHCDHRVVWGGDATVARFRSIPLPAHASERTFSSKLSCVVLNAVTLADADESDWRKLATALLADIVPFEQNACSSPRVVCWVGVAEPGAQAIRLDAELGRLSHERLRADVGLAVHRLEQAFLLAADNLGRNFRFGVGIASTEAADEFPTERLELNGGLLVHRAFTALDAVATLVGPASQTVGHFGFSGDEVRQLARIVGRRGADRVVPVGKALEFTALWDGFDLWNDFCRGVAVAT